jgi:hypothetical protein
VLWVPQVVRPTQKVLALTCRRAAGSHPHRSRPWLEPLRSISLSFPYQQSIVDSTSLRIPYLTHHQEGRFRGRSVMEGDGSGTARATGQEGARHGDGVGELGLQGNRIE